MLFGLAILAPASIDEGINEQQRRSSRDDIKAEDELQSEACGQGTFRKRRMLRERDHGNMLLLRGSLLLCYDNDDDECWCSHDAKQHAQMGESMCALNQILNENT